MQQRDVDERVEAETLTREMPSETWAKGVATNSSLLSRSAALHVTALVVAPRISALMAGSWGGRSPAARARARSSRGVVDEFGGERGQRVFGEVDARVLGVGDAALGRGSSSLVTAASDAVRRGRRAARTPPDAVAVDVDVPPRTPWPELHCWAAASSSERKSVEADANQSTTVAVPAGLPSVPLMDSPA